MKNLLGISDVDWKTLAINILMIAAGSFICSAGINTFLVPHKFVSPGVGGLALLVSYMTALPVGMLVFVFNIPLFILGFKYVGRVFIVGSFVGVVAFSFTLYATGWMAAMNWAPEKLLSAIIGGVLSGAGTGIVFRAHSSLGGTDIIAAAVRKKWSLSIGTAAFCFNALILLVMAFVYGLNASLYSLIALFCSAAAIDRVMMGLDTSKALFIITSEPKQIADLILRKLHRGVTLLDGEGAYLGTKKTVVFCVVSLSQLARAKHYVKSVDPDAFLTVAEVSEVMGKGFKTSVV